MFCNCEQEEEALYCVFVKKKTQQAVHKSVCVDQHKNSLYRVTRALVSVE